MNRRLLAACLLTVLLCGATACPASAAAAVGLEGCAGIDDDAARLRCYDEAAGRKPKAPDATAAPAPPAEPKGEEPTFLSKRWQLDEKSRQKRYAIMSHRQNYILPYTYNFHQEKATYESANPNTEIQDAEAKYQISLKVKLWQDILGTPMDLWFAYTQMSYWQVYNTEFSSPFRETNYEPEILLNYRTNTDLLGLVRSRFIQAGLNHQSNGRGEPLSRSWNRIVANFGFERDVFNAQLKTWLRIPESADKDDNRDIESFLGYGELWLGTVWRDFHLALMLRNNLRFDDNRGAMQFELSFPLIEHINGYVQYFVGYGESLIDYNHYTNRIGVGMMLKDW